MPESRVCFAALPASFPAFREALPTSPDQNPSAEDVVPRTILLGGLGDDQSPVEMQSAFLAPRLLPRLSRRQGDAPSAARAAFEAAPCLVVLLPIGCYDDGVWTPIIARLIANPPPARRETILAWSGIEPFLAPFQGGRDPWTNPAIAPTLLSAFERQARSLSAIIRARPADNAEPPLRRGIVRFEPGRQGAPETVKLALA